MGITVKRFESIISVPHDQPKRYPAGDNLYFRVGKARFDRDKKKLVPGAVSFLMRYEVSGKDKWHGIGSLSEITFTEARDVVRKKRQLQRDGMDPIKEARAVVANPPTVPTFKQAAETRFNLIEKKWTSQKNRDQWLSSLEQHAYPIIGEMLVPDIATPHIIEVLLPIWTKRRQTADRVRNRIKDILDWATVAGHRSGLNPARWDGHLNMLLPERGKKKQQHHPALPFEEMPRFMQELRAREGVNARCLEFLILTAARANEAIGARLEEIDFDAKIWTVPEDRMKMRKEHRVPLSSRAIEILQSLHMEEGEYLFIGARYGRSLGKMALPNLLDSFKRVDEAGRSVTVHGMRSSFRDWAGETTKHANTVIEYALAHRVGGTEGAYARGDLLEKRRILMADWARYCQSQARGATITPLKGRTASGA